LTDGAVNAAPIPDPASLAQGIAIARQAAGTLAIASVDLRMAGEAPRIQFADASGRRSEMRRFDARSGAPLPADSDDLLPVSATRDEVTQRDTLKAWHRGNVAGLAGQFVGVLAGLSLVTMAATGIALYLRTWMIRRAAGQRAFFWRAKESVVRRLHRWIAIVAAIFVLNVGISGTILAIGELQLNLFLQKGIGVPPYPRPGPTPPVSEAPIEGDIAAMLAKIYRAALAVAPDVPVTGVQLVVRDGLVKGICVMGGARAQVLAFDANTARPVADWASTGMQVGNGYFADWHQVFKRMHRGDIVGSFAGRYFDICVGIAILYLVLSSFVLYRESWRRRRAAGKQGFFWR